MGQVGWIRSLEGIQGFLHRVCGKFVKSIFKCVEFRCLSGPNVVLQGVIERLSIYSLGGFAISLVCWRVYQWSVCFWCCFCVSVIYFVFLLWLNGWLYHKYRLLWGLFIILWPSHNCAVHCIINKCFFFKYNKLRLQNMFFLAGNWFPYMNVNTTLYILISFVVINI